MMARQVARQFCVGWEKSIAWSMDAEQVAEMAANWPPTLR
jgi:hypothetical protein